MSIITAVNVALKGFAKDKVGIKCNCCGQRMRIVVFNGTYSLLACEHCNHCIPDAAILKVSP
jgi:ssDNA-binding Zn-finger/Zn-ribbon topoisomerase 1